MTTRKILQLEEITYDDMGAKLIERLPELRPKYSAMLEWWDDEKPGQHVVYGDILNPYLKELLEKGDPAERLEIIFDFLENMANSSDEGVRNVLYVTVLEYFLGDKERLKKMRSYMRPKTLEFSYEIEDYMKEMGERIRKRINKNKKTH